MSRKSSFVPDFESSSVNDDVCSKESESISAIMARVANAPVRTAYPVANRRSSFIIESSALKSKHNRSHNDSNVPYNVSNRHTDDYQCGIIPKSQSPDWLVHPENYRCTQCGRYCSDAFLVNKLCGYCRGDY